MAYVSSFDVCLVSISNFRKFDVSVLTFLLKFKVSSFSPFLESQNLSISFIRTSMLLIFLFWGKTVSTVWIYWNEISEI